MTTETRKSVAIYRLQDKHVEEINKAIDAGETVWFSPHSDEFGLDYLELKWKIEVENVMEIGNDPLVRQTANTLAKLSGLSEEDLDVFESTDRIVVWNIYLGDDIRKTQIGTNMYCSYVIGDKPDFNIIPAVEEIKFERLKARVAKTIPAEKIISEVKKIDFDTPAIFESFEAMLRNLKPGKKLMFTTTSENTPKQVLSMEKMEMHQISNPNEAKDYNNLFKYVNNGKHVEIGDWNGAYNFVMLEEDGTKIKERVCMFFNAYYFIQEE